MSTVGVKGLVHVREAYDRPTEWANLEKLAGGSADDQRGGVTVDRYTE